MNVENAINEKKKKNVKHGTYGKRRLNLLKERK